MKKKLSISSGDINLRTGAVTKPKKKYKGGLMYVKKNRLILEYPKNMKEIGVGWGAREGMRALVRCIHCHHQWLPRIEKSHYQCSKCKRLTPKK